MLQHSGYTTMILCSQELQQEHRRQTEATLGDAVLKF